MSELSCKFAQGQDDGLHEMEERAQEVSNLLKTLAHPERLKALCILAGGEQSVALLQQASSLSQSALSQHLAVLRKGDIIQMRKEAQCVFYSIKDPRILNLLGALKTCI